LEDEEDVMDFPAVMVAMVGPDHSGGQDSHLSAVLSIGSMLIE
jgi:hypothetical protein